MGLEILALPKQGKSGSATVDDLQKDENNLVKLSLNEESISGTRILSI